MIASTMNKPRSFGYRMGSWLRRAWDGVSRAEKNLAWRVQRKVPGGYAITRIVFLTAKLAVAVALLYVSFWIAVSVIALALFGYLVFIGAREGKGADLFFVDYDDIHHPAHKVEHPYHPNNCRNSQ